MSREAMKQALEALEFEASGWEDAPPITRNAITTLRKALETEQEPVAWMHNFITNNVITHIPADIGRHPERWTPLYTAPPKAAEWFDCTDAQLIDEVRRRGFVIRDAQIDPVKREWVGLTDEDMEALFLNEDGVRFARYIEAKLKARNV